LDVPLHVAILGFIEEDVWEWDAILPAVCQEEGLATVLELAVLGHAVQPQQQRLLS
jgi:hypothetical protein